MKFFKAIINFFVEIVAELKKVTWPTKDDVVAQTIVVVWMLVVLSAVLALMDFGGLQVISFLLTLGK